MRQKVLAVGIAFLMVATASLSVLAQGNGNSSTKPTKTTDELVQQRLAARETAREELSAEKQARIQERCQAAQGKIQSVAERLEKFQGTHSGIYNSWFTKLADLLVRLESTEGVDATQLRADIEALDALITELQAGFDDYSTEITTLLNMDCTESPQSFHDSLLAARDLRKNIVDGMKSVKEHIKTSIKDDLMDIKDQLKKDKADVEEEGEQ